MTVSCSSKLNSSNIFLFPPLIKIIFLSFFFLFLFFLCPFHSFFLSQKQHSQTLNSLSSSSNSRLSLILLIKLSPMPIHYPPYNRHRSSCTIASKLALTQSTSLTHLRESSTSSHCWPHAARRGLVGLDRAAWRQRAAAPV